MAVCLECHAEMKQTAAACPSCGHDYRDVEEAWSDLLHRKSSLRDLFRLVTVIGLPLAVVYYFAPIADVFGANQPGHGTAGAFVLLVGLSFYFCGWVLNDAAPLSARLFNAAGILALATWPLFRF